MLLCLLCPGPRGERDRVQTENGGSNGSGLPNAGEYAIPAASARKALLVLLIDVGHLVKVTVLFRKEAYVLSVFLRRRALNVYDTYYE